MYVVNCDAKKNLVEGKIEKIYVFLTNLSQTMSTLTPSIFNLPSLSVSSSFKKWGKAFFFDLKSDFLEHFQDMT